MPNYRRLYMPGGTYSFTVATGGRSPIFREPDAVLTLARSMRQIRAKHSFTTVAMIVLPDHLHCIWALPREDSDFSTRWRRIKSVFTTAWVAHVNLSPARSESQASRGERGVWQRRFWEHLIRDENDMERHFDYIHFNAVKHGYVHHPSEWPWSTFARHVRLGAYPPEWGTVEPPAPDFRPFE